MMICVLTRNPGCEDLEESIHQRTLKYSERVCYVATRVCESKQ